MLILARGTYGESPDLLNVLWIDGKVVDWSADPRIKPALEREAAEEPVLALPEVIREPLSDPLGFVGVCRRVLKDPVFRGDAEANELLDPAEDVIQ